MLQQDCAPLSLAYRLVTSQFPSHSLDIYRLWTTWDLLLSARWWLTDSCLAGYDVTLLFYKVFTLVMLTFGFDLMRFCYLDLLSTLNQQAIELIEKTL